MRSDRQPITQFGLGCNRMMGIWTAAVAVFLLLISVIPGAQHLMKITTLSVFQWGIILGATLLGTFGLEIKKMITYQK